MGDLKFNELSEANAVLVFLFAFWVNQKSKIRPIRQK